MMFPVILSFPDMNALIASSFPSKILTAFSSSIERMQSALPVFGDPLWMLPSPFLRSRVQTEATCPF